MGKTRAQKKFSNQMFGLLLMGGGILAQVVMLGLIGTVLSHGTTTGTMRSGTAYYAPPGTTTEKPVVSWFHSSGRENLREGQRITVILYPDGGHATSKSPWLLALYTSLGGLAAIGLGYVFFRWP